MRRSLFTRLGGVLLLVLIGALGLVGGSSRPAFAHAALTSSTPAANSVLEVSPPAIILEFDEAIEAPLASIRLFDAGGTAVQVGSPAVGDSDSIVTATIPTLDDGLYAVIWRVTSADGHVVDGAFSFQVGTASTGDGADLIAQVSIGSRAAPAVRWWYGVARFLSLGGALVLLGGLAWLLLLGAPADVRRGARRLLNGSWAALLVGSLAAFGLFGAEVSAGTLGTAFDPKSWGDIVHTQTGRMLLLRIVFAALFGVLLVLRKFRGAGWWRAAAATAAVFLLFSCSASGHPNAQDPRALWIAIDMLHLLAIAIWIGGLFAIAVAGRSTLSEPGGERFARRFSLAASVTVPVIIATGVAQTLKLAGGLDDVTSTDWGRLLLTKVTVVAALLAVAGVSRWLLHHDGAASIRRTVIAEAVLGVAVVAMAAGMVALPPVPPAPSQPFNEQLASNGLLALISLSPGRVGGNEVHITLTPQGGSLTPVLGATARVALPDGDIPFSPVTLVLEGPNHFSGSITFPRSGSWTFELIVEVTAGNNVLLKTTVPIP